MVVMKLVYSPANAAWAFMWGNVLDAARMQWTQMGEYSLFFHTRKDAVRAANEKGLLVSRSNIVTVDPAKCEHPADAHTESLLKCARPTLITACGSCGKTLSMRDA